MNIQMRWRSYIFVAMMVLLMGRAGTVWGNGVYIPERAYPALPTIPVQRAIVVYRDGVQTLVVESAFQTESKDVAWILPLPALPTKLEVGDAGMVTSACSAMRPKITHDLHQLWVVPAWAVVLLVPFVWVRIRTADHKRRHSRYATYGFAVVVLALWCAVLLPTLGTAGGGSAVTTAGVQVHSVERLGDYECTVLNASDAEVLSAWLTERSLKPLDAESQAVVADYIARGWCFVVTQLQPATSEVVVPRPLMATFTTSSPVFPMKATSLAKTKTRVELCVISDQEATAQNFTSPAAADFVRSNGDLATSPFYHSKPAKLWIGSPDVVALMWNNCVVTKLQADWPPTQMDTDVTIHFKPLQGGGHRDHLFSTMARRHIAATILLSAAVAGLLIAAVIYRHGRKASRGQRRFLLRAVGVIVGAGLGVWLLLPTIPVQTGSWASEWRQNYKLRGAIQAYYVKVSEEDDLPDWSAVNLPQVLLNGGFIESPITNPFTGQPVRRERSPGNFDVRKLDGMWQLCTYNQDGIEQRTMELER